MHPAFGNEVVLTGIRYNLSRVTEGDYGYASSNHVVVGHNLKFDFGFQYHRNQSNLEDLICLERPIWDTQVAEYVNGNGLMSLEAACELHGVPFKKDGEIKKYWAEGYDTEEIPTDKLEEYLYGDLEATEALYLKQREAYKNHKLIVEMSKVSAALAHMEQEGMYVDEDKLLEYAADLMAEAKEIEQDVLKNLESRGWPSDKEFSPNSAAHLSLLFFGGGFEVMESKKIGKFKNGKDKFKKVPVVKFVQAPVDRPNVPDLTSTGKPSFSDQWFQENGESTEEVKAIHRLRAIKKELGTFVKGIAQNRNDETGLLHGNLNHCLTGTGRLSSSDPNLQNLPNGSDLKKCFTSRYGEGGRIIEIDYSQLEVIVLAMLSGDYQLLKDIKDGTDLHFETGKSVMGWTTPYDMTKEERRQVKGVNFGLIYGGKGASLAKRVGVPRSVVDKLIDAFYTRYPGVKEWQENNITKVCANAAWSSEVTASGRPAMKSQLVSPFGRVWKFVQEDPPFNGAPNFSPTKIKNYPVQGTATGDLVPMAVRQVLVNILRYPIQGVHLTCTIHDSIILDVEGGDGRARAIAKHLMEVMTEDLEYYIKGMFNIELPVGLKVEASIGRNWKEQEEL